MVRARAASVRCAWVHAIRATAVALGIGVATVPSAQAWSTEGHTAIALMAQRHLLPEVRAEIDALLAEDDTRLTPDTSMASESMWADRWRDSDRGEGSHQRYNATRRWHFVNLPLLPEPALPDVALACRSGREAVVPRWPSEGPASACIVDRIEAFRAVLVQRQAPRHERLRALQYLLHFVGDIHQPLHTVDAGDRGGNDRKVLPPRRSQPVKLHEAWDRDLVRAIHRDPQVLADRLEAGISDEERRAWRVLHSASAWALESYSVGRREIHAVMPPAREDGVVVYADSEWLQARDAAARQLQRASVRLAELLNRALSSGAD